MRRFATLLVGIGLGFVLAHFVNQSPQGRRFFEQVNQAGHELADAVVQGYNVG
ncbi:MAG: hypothetical protein ACTJFR_00455 [Canibacter sp.]